jgi:hypothetical protein
MEKKLEPGIFFSTTQPIKITSIIDKQKINKQQMIKQKLLKSPSQGHTGGNSTMKDRYYVQRLTEQVFLIRERISMEKEPGPDDRLVRAFDMRHDADLYADNANNRQRKLDEQNNH